MNIDIEATWKRQLESEFEKSYFTDLVHFVRHEYEQETIFPKGKDIFRAFDTCTFPETRVVILGQDPYHGPNQAHGLCFSVNRGVRVPPSLRNIFKEVKDDLGCEIPTSGDLSPWAKQGVLLLNATLTVRAGSPGSHQKKGWEIFTDRVVESLSNNREQLVFLLWGAYAQRKGAVIDRSKHLVLEAAHPSPFAAHKGFFGCKHFSRTNRYLAENNSPPISWCL